MALDFRKFFAGINIFPKTTSTVDSAGDIDFSTDIDKLNMHNGTTASPIVTETHAATLENKTIDGNDNTLLNIPGSAIVGPIDAAEIADGSVSNTEFEYLDGVTSDIQTQLNGKASNTLVDSHILVGNASNVATDVAVTGDIAISNAGVVAISTGVIVNTDINASAAIDATKIATGSVDNTEFGYLDGVTSAIQTQLNTNAGNISTHTGASSGVHGVLGDVVGTTDTQTLSNKTIGPTNTITVRDTLFTVQDNVDATKQLQLDLSGISTTTTRTLTAPDANTTIVGTDAAQVITNKDIDGGTASNTSRLTAPKASKATLDGLTRKEATLLYASDQDKLYVDTGSILKAVGSGSGGGVNFMPLTSVWSPDNTDNADAENGLGDWVTFADAASPTPVDLTGGTATNLTLSRTTTAGEVLDGNASFKIVKTANDSQGQGASCTFNVPPAYQGKQTQINIPYKISTGSLASGDLSVWIYDVTNSILITPANQMLGGTSGTINASFLSTPSAGTPANQQYRIGLYFGSTSATAVTIEFDDVSVGPQEPVVVGNITPWQSYVPVITGAGTVTAENVEWRQVGDSIQVRGNVTSGTGTATEFRWSLPNSLVSASSYPSTSVAGRFDVSNATTTRFITLIEPSVSYFTIAIDSGGQLTKTDGANFSNGEVLSIFAETRIETLTASTPAVILNPNIGPWQSYTPAIVGFGTVTDVNFMWRQVGENIEVQGTWTNGTTTATEAQVPLPPGLLISSSYPAIGEVGTGGSSTDNRTIHLLVSPSDTYFKLGFDTSTPANGNSWNIGEVEHVCGTVKVQGLSANGVVNQITTWSAYTPTINGVGTATSVSFEWRKSGPDTLEIQGSFVSGTSTATPLTFTLPTGYSVGANLAANSYVGSGTRDNVSGGAYTVIAAAPSDTTLGIGSTSGNGLAIQNGNALVTSGDQVSFIARVRI